MLTLPQYSFQENTISPYIGHHQAAHHISTLTISFAVGTLGIRLRDQLIQHHDLRDHRKATKMKGVSASERDHAYQSLY